MCVQELGNDTEGVEGGPDIVPIWKRKGDVHAPEVQGHHPTGAR